MRSVPALLFAFSAIAGSPALPAAEPTARHVPLASIKVAAGFELTRIHAVRRDAEGSWVSVAADAQGRLYASDQYGPIYRIEPARAASGAPTVTPLPLPIGGVHGMTWINGSLYAVVGQKTVCPPGLYRLRDRDGDGDLDTVECLRELAGDGEHGPHAVAAGPDGESLYVLAGNATRLPELVRSRVPRLWGEDSLLAPLPALMGSETRGVLPGGWICRTDLEGREWELVSAGLRNAYALAFDPHGELFTCDSDTEFELNLPWYRPTRVLHAVSGADFGWRGGALKVPERAADAWPAVLAMGLGSPTAVLTTPGARLPARYRDALWVADWSYGKISALRLAPAGATFTATREEVVSGMPLPVTAMCVNPADGAIYFTTGGRRLQSALYRLAWDASIEPVMAASRAGTAETTLRRDLEHYHGRVDAAALDRAWPALGSTDRVVRHAARTAIESQPVATWRSRALAERAPRVALAGLLALARADAPRSRAELLAALERLEVARLDDELRREWLRVLSLTFSRGGAPDSEVRARWAARVEPLFPTGQHETDAALLEMLVFLEAPGAAAEGLAALRGAVTREAQLDFARSLRVLRTTWTPPLRQEFFDWLGQTATWRGGGSFGRFLQRLRDDALASAPDEERAELSAGLARAAATSTAREAGAPSPRTFVRAWTTDELTKLAEQHTGRRDVERGRRLFAAAGCFACHSVNGEGAALGPDLTAIAGRFSFRDLFEAIVEPSREISDQYHTVQVRTTDGREISGRIVNLTENGLHLAQNLFEPASVVRLPEREIASITPSSVSLMPPGLLDMLSADEILDLVAFLRSPRTEQ